MGQGVGEGMGHWDVRSACALLAPHCVPRPGTCLNPTVSIFFVEVPFGRHNGLNPRPLVTELNLQSLSPLRRVELKIPNL